jgi:hypothetical protein
MTGFALTAVILSFVLLAAHFSRHEIPFLMALSLLAPILLFVKRPWVPRLLQLLLVVGALEWVRTAAVLAARRIDVGAPWLRMVVILGAVALVTIGAAALLQSTRVRHWFGTNTPTP